SGSAFNCPSVALTPTSSTLPGAKIRATLSISVRDAGSGTNSGRAFASKMPAERKGFGTLFPSESYGTSPIAKSGKSVRVVARVLRRAWSTVADGAKLTVGVHDVWARPAE